MYAHSLGCTTQNEIIIFGGFIKTDEHLISSTRGLVFNTKTEYIETIGNLTTPIYLEASTPIIHDNTIYSLRKINSKNDSHLAEFTRTFQVCEISSFSGGQIIDIINAEHIMKMAQKGKKGKSN